MLAVFCLPTYLQLMFRLHVVYVSYMALNLKEDFVYLVNFSSLLKLKFSEDGVQKKMNSLGIELLKLRNLLNVKKVSDSNAIGPNFCHRIN